MRLARMAVAVLGSFAGCASAVVPAPHLPLPAVDGKPGAMRVMTFNVRFGTAPDGDNDWNHRRQLAVAVIRDFAPAVLGVQEALRFQLDELERAFPRYAEVGVGRDDGVRAGEYAAILYDSLRFQSLASGRFWLSATPEVPGSMTWGNRYPRIVTWARLFDRNTGLTFTAYDTHWDHESQVARENGARLMLAHLAARPGADEPVLLLGDLNCGDDNPAFRILTTGPVPLLDTFRRLHASAVDTGTFHAFRGDRTGPKIDFILVSPRWQILDAAIIYPRQGERFPSDHFPVVATVELHP